jgi:hypothetical protein
MKKRPLFACLLTLAVVAGAGSARAQNQAASPSRQEKVSTELLRSDKKFTPDAKIEERSIKTASATEIEKIESGSLNGVPYRFFYKDGGGVFAGTRGNAATYSEPINSNWQVRCEKDPLTGEKHCEMQMRDLYVFLFATGKIIVSVGSGHYPGSDVVVQMDKDPPISAPAGEDGDFNAKTSLQLVQQLKKAKTVTTRYMKWPYKTWKDETWEIYGFNEAFQYLNWAVERMK